MKIISKTVTHKLGKLVEVLLYESYFTAPAAA
jgi:hypothetical protein